MRTSLAAVSVVALVMAAAPGRPARAEDEGTTANEASIQRADHAGGIRALLGPGTGVPKIGPDGDVLAYARWADTAMRTGQDAQAALSLEWAQARNRIDEVEAAYRRGDPPPPYDDYCTRPLCQALHSLGMGDRRGARRQIWAEIERLRADASRQAAGSVRVASGN